MTPDNTIPNPALYTSDKFKVTDFSPKYWQTAKGEISYDETRFIPYSSKYDDFLFETFCDNSTPLPTGILKWKKTTLDGRTWFIYDDAGSIKIWSKTQEEKFLNELETLEEEVLDFEILEGKYLCFIGETSLSAFLAKSSSLFLSKSVSFSAYHYDNGTLSFIGTDGKYRDL
jgi:hypothetical protein